MPKPQTFDVIVLGAGAAGLMCAIEAGKRGRRVLVLDHANKAGKKILMSGGGRCNFTNLSVSAANFISHNPQFCKSALSRYTPNDFITLVKQHQVPYHEKTLGQLFCDNKSKDILNVLLKECQAVSVNIQLLTAIESVSALPEKGFQLKTTKGDYTCESLVVATGGLSIPTMGASPFGYRLAEQFALNVWSTRAGLVPFTLQNAAKEHFDGLSGIALACKAHCKKVSFKEGLLFTHRGLSGPAMLQISSYWRPGEALTVNLLPGENLFERLIAAKKQQPNQLLKNCLQQYFPKRLVAIWLEGDRCASPSFPRGRKSSHFASKNEKSERPASIPACAGMVECLGQKTLQHCSNQLLQAIADAFQRFSIKPNGTEGYRTAEVTLGGVDCNAISSKTFETKTVPGLYFIGEVLDVTGWLGGYNFQWAWSSGFAAGQYC